MVMGPCVRKDDVNIDPITNLHRAHIHYRFASLANQVLPRLVPLGLLPH